MIVTQKVEYLKISYNQSQLRERSQRFKHIIYFIKAKRLKNIHIFSVRL